MAAQTTPRRLRRTTSDAPDFVQVAVGTPLGACVFSAVVTKSASFEISLGRQLVRKFV